MQGQPARVTLVARRPKDARAQGLQPSSWLAGDSRESDVAEREDAVEAAEAAALVGSAGDGSSDDDGADAGGSTYYENCDAARADGAAPVYSGDPGYGSHLDRDGDGIGCE
jgi:hypothetical protein